MQVRIPHTPSAPLTSSFVAHVIICYRVASRINFRGKPNTRLDLFHLLFANTVRICTISRYVHLQQNPGTICCCFFSASRMNAGGGPRSSARLNVKPKAETQGYPKLSKVSPTLSRSKFIARTRIQRHLSAEFQTFKCSSCTNTLRYLAAGFQSSAATNPSPGSSHLAARFARPNPRIFCIWRTTTSAFSTGLLAIFTGNRGFFFSLSAPTKILN